MLTNVVTTTQNNVIPYPLQYSHCIKATPGQPDRSPYTQYETRSVDVLIQRLSDDSSDDSSDDDTFVVTRNGEQLGWGECKADAIFDAVYNLMDRSRTAAGFVRRS